MNTPYISAAMTQKKKVGRPVCETTMPRITALGVTRRYLLCRSVFFSDNFAKVMELVLRIAQLEEENSRKSVTGRRLTAEQKVRPSKK